VFNAFLLSPHSSNQVLHGETLWYFPLLQLFSVSLCLREMHKPFSCPFIAFTQGAEIAKEIQLLFLLFFYSSSCPSLRS